MPTNTPPGTIYRRALRRVDRRSRAYLEQAGTHGPGATIHHALQPIPAASLLTEACRLANALAIAAYGPRWQARERR